MVCGEALEWYDGLALGGSSRQASDVFSVAETWGRSDCSNFETPADLPPSFGIDASTSRD